MRMVAQFRVKECYGLLKSVKRQENAFRFAYIQSMKLNPRTIRIIIVLSVVALAGLVWLQVHLLMNAAEQKEEAFRRSASAALTSIVQRLEIDETSHQFAFGESSKWNSGKTTIAVVGTTKSGGHDSGEIRVEARQFEHRLPLPGSLQDVPLQVMGNRVRYTVKTPQRVRLRMFNPGGRADTLLVDTTKLPGTYESIIDTADQSGMTRVFQYSADSASFVVSVAHTGTDVPIFRGVPTKEREDAVRRAFDKIILVEGLPIEKRLNVGKLDSVSTLALRESGIELPYVFGVISAKDSVKLMKSAGYADQLRQSEFKARMFPGDVFAEHNSLALFFPDRKIFLLKQMGPMIAATCVFMLMIVFGFGYTVRTVFRQKRMATHMVDFINNMTHEFKTPISTIALATEAISRPDVLAHTDKVVRYNGVIQDENTRMRHQVEKILQMAVLEEGDTEIQWAAVDIHEIIKGAVANIALQVESKEGKVTTELHASHHVVNGDAVHISNIMHNLLENATKYSPEHPTIEVSTRNVDDTLMVRVSDRGIGMSNEDAKRAFDKYFRVSMGNQHDVKGFGLGLSYVKLMVEAHQGSVRIESERGKGTVVEITFPTATVPGES